MRRQRISLTVSVGRVKDVELTPCQGSTRIAGGAWRGGLHALHLANMLTRNRSSVAAVAAVATRQSQAGVGKDKMKEFHDHVLETKMEGKLALQRSLSIVSLYVHAGAVLKYWS